MSTDPHPARVTAASAASFPYDYWHDRYQEYYREGVRRHLAAAGGSFRVEAAGLPGVLAKLRQARHSTRVRRALGPVGPAANRLVDGLAWCLGGRRRPVAPLVGRYTFRRGDGRTVRAAIDSQDSGDVASADLLAASDVYFKTNYWDGRGYDRKVRPLFNLNPLVLHHLDDLLALRSRPAKYDFCLVVRVWGGADELEGVEHCVRLLEAAALARGRKYLLAYLVAGDTAAVADRLARSGVPSTTDPLPLPELWRVAAESRVNVIRLGMHHCIPWRMCDLLALGTGTVLDQPPKTVWPVPLSDGEQYVTLGLDTAPGRPTAGDDAYRRVPELLDELVNDAGRVDRLRHAAATYFDRHLRPEQVGRHICEAVSGC
jgi:hypothetical protein